MQEKRSQAERRAATRDALLAAARGEFVEHGFAAAATEAVVRRAGVTRGALYYHFPDKAALLAAVVEAVAAEVHDAVAAAASRSASPGHALADGMRAYLDACLSADARSIYLVDGPAVLGWRRWREIDGAYSARLLREGVSEALAGSDGRDVDALTTLLSGACNEAALWLADAPDDADRKRAVDLAVDDLVKRLFSE
ncbi:helix-turn-helix domain-containing protein [Thalassobaculum sp.]|uniref:helix-turn-helix domain-containing protein n=1 Tax=Thalassobaculum sp. TaxID=2022740 RepID=UPI0032ECA873